MKAEYIDHLGDDLRVVNAARVSFNKESKWEADHSVRQELSDKDKKLIKYLANNNHFTPFTHPVITIRETVPIFVASQRFKQGLLTMKLVDDMLLTIGNTFVLIDGVSQQRM